MSYDLYFWKQTADCTTMPSEIVESFITGDKILGLEPIPITQILAQLQKIFPQLKPANPKNPKSEPRLEWQSKGGASCFFVSWSELHFEIEGYNVRKSRYNQIIDIALEFNCPLYDPQTDVRYENQTK